MKTYRIAQLHNNSDLRDDLFEGRIIRLPMCEAVNSLISAMRTRLVQAVGCEDPQSALDIMEPGDLWDRLGNLRREIAGLSWDQYSGTIIKAAGLPCRGVLVDGLRLRVVVPAHLRTPQMAKAYLPHRDTWFANPRQQINIWMPLADLTEDQSFAFYPSVFNAPVQNNSAAFDFKDFITNAGWQGANTQQAKSAVVYPTVEEPLPTPLQRFALQCGESILFSASHLHQTMPNTSTFIRYSLDFRFVDPADVEAGHGAPDLDNASRGLAEALATYRML